jgi:hypothetical protein
MRILGNLTRLELNLYTNLNSDVNMNLMDNINDKYKDVSTSMIITSPSLGGISFSMFVNPNELTWDLGNKRQQVDEPLEGNFESNFPSDFETLSVSGTSGAFIHDDVGILFTEREDTVAYQKFQALIEIIKNNGMTYNNEGRPTDVSPLNVYYLGAVWSGNFRSFISTEEDSSPIQFRIQFEFKVDKTAVRT